LGSDSDHGSHSDGQEREEFGEGAHEILKLSRGEGPVRVRIKLGDGRSVKIFRPEAFKFKPTRLKYNFRKATQTLTIFL
jgi:hypothetical protein